MDAGTAKKLIEKNLSYHEVKRLAVKLVQHASPQTALLEAEPQVLALIRDIVQAAPSTFPYVETINNRILTGELYKALKEAKNLIDYERELLQNAQCGQGL